MTARRLQPNWRFSRKPGAVQNSPGRRFPIFLGSVSSRERSASSDAGKALAVLVLE